MSEQSREAARTDAWVALLVEWYRQNARELPWRADHDPYHVWISEIMLQQTRIEAVMDYYFRFMKAFPTVEALAEADEETVLKMWEGLGYYSRARNLHKAAKQIAEAGSFPDTFEKIRALPGVGEYTAGAISAIAFGLPETAVDGNVMRVVSRLEVLEDNVLLEPSRKKVREILKAHYPIDDSREFVQGLMELGEVICLPAAPQCGKCPLQEKCLAKAQGRTEELPVREKNTDRRIEHLAVLRVRNSRGQLLVFRRPEGNVLAGLWELPNVPIDPEEAGQKRADQQSLFDGDETVSQKILAELKEKYGIDGAEWKPVFSQHEKHVFTHITWNMDVYDAGTAGEGEESLPRSGGPLPEGRWVSTEEVMLPTAFRKLLN